MKKKSVNPKEYVVFDVETNGLKPKQDDLLSISFYKPDDGKEMNKYLPLELNRKVVTTAINGITEDTLTGAIHLTQEEFDQLVEEFELGTRTILVYSGRDFDAGFLAEYLRRHRITGFDKLNFYNFKKHIISSRYSHGNVTKDNLCRLFGISGVESVHSGSNDCRLEWELFKKMDGDYYLVTEGDGEDNVFRLNDEYIIPASLLSSHPNLSRLLSDRPYIECHSTLVKSFEIDAHGIEKFPTNFTGMTIEHLINSMLNVKTHDSRPFLLENKKKLDFIGKIPNGVVSVPMVFNPDGTVTAVHKADKEMEKRINSTAENLRERIAPLVEFIRGEVFKNKEIESQELVIDSRNNILALCDLSTDEAILEIKTNSSDSLAYKEQFFYEAKGREVYHLKMEWVKDWTTDLLEKVIFHIGYVNVCEGNPGVPNWTDGKREERRSIKIAELHRFLADTEIELSSFMNTSSPVMIKCKQCEHEWKIGYSTLMKKIPLCPYCTANLRTKRRSPMSEEERQKLRADRYYEKILEKSKRQIVALNYVGAKETVDAICVVCGNKWKSRADHLADRCWCPACKKME